MNVLVTAGSGFIGSHVVDHLLAAGDAVRSLDLADAREVLPDGCETLVGDLLDPPTLAAAAEAAKRSSSWLRRLTSGS